MVEDSHASHPPSRAIRYGEYVYPLGEGVQGEWPETGVETLRRAAARMRWSQEIREKPDAFMMTVADWLDAAARSDAQAYRHALTVARAYLGESA